MHTGSRLAKFAIVEKNHVMIQMEDGRSLCGRWIHVIPSVPIKDRIIGGPLVILNVASHLVG